jgi:hypothetical protein
MSVTQDYLAHAHALEHRHDAVDDAARERARTAVLHAAARLEPDDAGAAAQQVLDALGLSTSPPSPDRHDESHP